MKGCGDDHSVVLAPLSSGIRLIRETARRNGDIFEEKQPLERQKRRRMDLVSHSLRRAKIAKARLSYPVKRARRRVSARDKDGSGRGPKRP